MIDPYYTKMLELNGTTEDGLLYGSGCLSAGVFTVGAVTVSSFSGDGTCSVTAGDMTVVGEAWDILLSDGSRYPCAEGYGAVIYDVSANGNNVTGTGVSRDLQTKAHSQSFHWNALVGWSEYFDGSNIMRKPYLATGVINQSVVAGPLVRTGDYPHVEAMFKQCETQVDFEYWRISAVPSGAPTDYAAGDAKTPTGQMYAREQWCQGIPWSYDRVLFTATLLPEGDRYKLEHYTQLGLRCPFNISDSAPSLRFNRPQNSQYTPLI